MSDDVCRLKEISVEPLRIVRRITCDECGLCFKRIEIKAAHEFDADALAA